jgi:hypothetical membrane protein
MHEAMVRRIGMASGLLSAAVFLTLYTVAAFEDPGYAFYEDYLSDLGVGPAAWAFNSAVMVSGALTVAFALFGLRGVLGPGTLSRAGVLLLSAAGVMLVFIGVFTEDAGDLHLFFSLAFFLTLLTALGVLSAAFYVSRPLGSPGAAFTLAVFLFGLALAVLMGTTPQSETLAVFGTVAWGTIVSSALLVRETLLASRP